MNYMDRLLAASGEHGKRPLVLFSGGMDSTMLMERLLAYTHVYTFYVEANQAPHKVTKEKEARQALFELFRERFEYSVQGDQTFELNETYVKTANYAMVQPISWLTAGLIHFDPKRHSGLAVGYLLGDQAPAFRKDMDDFWRAGWALLRGHAEPAPPLWFPLLDMGYTKADVIKHLDRKLIHQTWVCENPLQRGERIVVCEDCKPCRLLKHTLDDYRDSNFGIEHPYRGETPNHIGQLEMDFADEDEDGNVQPAKVKGLKRLAKPACNDDADAAA